MNMTNNVIKFPDSINKALKRIERRFENQWHKYHYEVKRLNWFAGGFMIGSSLAFAIIAVCFVFFGAPQ